MSYSLADFLLFSPETYWRQFELMNSALWPAAAMIPTVLIGVAVLGVLGWRRSGWAVGVALAGCWAMVAHTYFGSYYATINWAIAWVIPFAWAQAVLALVLSPGLRFPRGLGHMWLRCAPIVVALAYPIVGLAAGRPLAQSEIVGLAPDPTALLTLGLTGLARPSWRILALSILPTAWLLLSAATLFAMAEPTAWVLGASLSLVAIRVWATPMPRRR
jgi:hypothetical protein